MPIFGAQNSTLWNETIGKGRPYLNTRSIMVFHHDNSRMLKIFLLQSTLGKTYLTIDSFVRLLVLKPLNASPYVKAYL